MRIARTTVGALVALVTLTSGAAAVWGAGAAAADSEPPGAPPVGACYRLGFGEATRPTSDAAPVSCRGRHTAQTYFVGRLDTVVDGHLLAVDSKRAQRQLEHTCPNRLDDYVGGSEETRALSRLASVWFSPTLQQSDRGASWFRCDVVAVAGSSRLAPLLPPRLLRHVLDRPDSLARVGLCGTAAPGSEDFSRVICSAKHSWRAISTIDISGGSAYPGVGAVRDAGESTCRDEVQQRSDSADRFSYGWEWPTREQWRSGQRFGYCWAPD
jgi:hypothetical protein